MNNNNNIKEQLINIVKENSITDIIMSNKIDMEMVDNQKLYKQWSKEVAILRQDLDQAKYNVLNLKEIIKKNCKHTKVTEIISPGWDRANHNYFCKQCNFYIRITDFDYRNITNVIDR